MADKIIYLPTEKMVILTVQPLEKSTLALAK